MADLKIIRVLSGVTALLTLVLISLGGFVRATGAGLSCPDWPLCFGRIVPEFTHGVAQEYIHRVIAGFVVLCSLAMLHLVFRSRKTYTFLYKLVVFLLILVMIQSVMGGLTVILQLNPFIITAHLALGSVFFQLLALLAAERICPKCENCEENKSEPKRARSVNFVLLILSGFVFLQIVLGGFVGSSGAALVCEGFPLCNGSLLPPEATAPQLLQISHRALAVFLLTCITAIYFFGRKSLLLMDQASSLRRVFFLTLLQFALGVANVLMYIPIWVAVLHLAVAQLILFELLNMSKSLSGTWFMRRIQKSMVP